MRAQRGQYGLPLSQKALHKRALSDWSTTSVGEFTHRVGAGCHSVVVLLLNGDVGEAEGERLIR